MYEEKLIQSGQLRLNLATGPDNGPPLLFLHGIARSWRDFAPVLPALSARARVSALDLRGHGRSDRADAYLVTDYVRDVVAFLRNYQSRPAVLFGHSLGSMVALAAAAHAPDRVSGLILEDPPFHTMGRRMTETLLVYFSGLQICARGPHASVAELAARLAAIRMPTPDGKTVSLADIREPTQIRFAARCLMDVDPAALEPVIQGHWLEGYELETLLQQGRCPILLLAADFCAGGMLTPDDAAFVRRTAQDCVRVDLPGACHLLHWHRTEEVVAHALAFIESL